MEFVVDATVLEAAVVEVVLEGLHRLCGDFAALVAWLLHHGLLIEGQLQCGRVRNQTNRREYAVSRIASPLPYQLIRTLRLTRNMDELPLHMHNLQSVLLEPLLIAL